MDNITIKTQYLGGLRTEAQNIRSGLKIITDAPTDNNGKGEAFSPTDLLAASLASCMVTIMGITASKNGIELGHPIIDVTKVMAAGPRRVSKVKVEIDMSGISFTPTEKELLTNAAINCPVAKSLHPDLEQELTINW